MESTATIISCFLIPPIIMAQITIGLDKTGNWFSEVNENEVKTAVELLSSPSLIEDSHIETSQFGFATIVPEFNDHQEMSALELRHRRTLITCNHTIQGRFSCNGCRQILHCYPFNLGTIKTCIGLFPYCNDGLCSRNKGSLCTDRSSSTTTVSPSSRSTESSMTTNSTSTSSTVAI